MQRNIPAVVQEAESLEHLMQGAKALSSEISCAERTTLEKAVALGKILIKIRDRVPHGEWEATLTTKIGISRDRADTYMLIAKCRAPGISSCKSIREATEMARHGQPEPSKGMCLKCEGAVRRGGKRDPKCRFCGNPGLAEDDLPPDEDAVVEKPEKPPKEREREPGDDDGPENPWVSNLRRAESTILKNLDDMKTRLEVHNAEDQSIRNLWNEFVMKFEQLAIKPARAFREPRHGTCDRCHNRVLWAQTENYKNVPLDETRGGWSIIDNVACPSPGQYSLHFLSCPKRPVT